MILLRDLKRAILTALDRNESGVPFGESRRRNAHRSNLIGRQGDQPGELERSLGVTFDIDDRVRAARAFDELRRDGYIRSTHRDLADPDNWVEITDLGHNFLARDLKDDIDLALEAISPHLVEVRGGMWDAIERTSPDAPRQAAHSARELVDQVLRSAPETCTTRKQRFRHLMRSRTGTVSKTDIDVLDASAKLVEVEHYAMLKDAHREGSPTQNEVRLRVEAAERILRLLFGEQ